MNNPNPFIPQGSVLEQNKRRSRMKLAVFCVLAVSVCGLTAMLIQGCKREQTTEIAPPVDTNNYATDTNLSPSMVSTGAPPAEVSTGLPPAAVAPPVVPPVVPETAGTEYVVVQFDTLSKIAKAHSVSLKALEAANPGVVPTKLKVGQKLTIPAGGTTAPAATETSTGTDMTGGSTGGGDIYIVKSNDTLGKIAKAHGVTLKALEAANPNVDPNHIKVGQKLKIPAKAETAPPAPVEAPAPAVPAVAPVTTPAPAGTPNGQ